MSEAVTPPSNNLIDAAPEPAPGSLPAAAPVAQAAAPSLATAVEQTMPTAAHGPHTILETLIRGLGPDADEAARAAARELCAQAAQSLAAAAPVATAAPVPAIAFPPTMPATSLPTSPITMAARALRQLPPDQLLDLLLQRLRAALPVGASVPAPRGIQFQLVPMTPPGSR